MGVRATDAVVFCEWLSDRDPGTWIYRLSKAGEFEKVAGNRNPNNRLTRGTGYWMDEGKRFAWAQAMPLLLENFNTEPFTNTDGFEFNLDYEQKLASKVNFALGHAFDVPFSFDLNIDYVTGLKKALLTNRFQEFGHLFSEALERIPKRSQVLNLAFDNAGIEDRGFGQILHLVRPTALKHALNHPHGSTFNHTVDYAFDESLYNIRRLYIEGLRLLELDRALDRALKLFRGRTLNNIHIPESCYIESEGSAFIPCYIRRLAYVLTMYLLYDISQRESIP